MKSGETIRMDEQKYNNMQIEPDEIKLAEDTQDAPIESAALVLAELLYDRTAANKVAARKWLMKNRPQELNSEVLETLLAGIDANHPQQKLCSISTVKGSKDRYYYDGAIMTREFAMLDALIEDKDILTTIASVTRSDCKLYPRPTEYAKLTDYPFQFTLDEVEGAAARMTLNEEYSDIGVVQASNGAKAFFSSLHISQAYARSLLEYSEVESKLWP